MPLGPKWQSGARTILIASRCPAPRRSPIGCCLALAARALPLCLPDRAAAQSGVGGEWPRVIPDIVLSWGSPAEVGGRGGAGRVGGGPAPSKPRPFPVCWAGPGLRACQPSSELPASPPAVHHLRAGAPGPPDRGRRLLEVRAASESVIWDPERMGPREERQQQRAGSHLPPARGPGSIQSGPGARQPNPPCSPGASSSPLERRRGA